VGQVINMLDPKYNHLRGVSWFTKTAPLIRERLWERRRKKNRDAINQRNIKR
jgi:hypothetical protein